MAQSNGIPFSGQFAIEAKAKQTLHGKQLTTIPFESAVELQQLIMAAARSEETTASALAQLARAWSELEGRKRIIKMKPDPKPIDVSAPIRRPKASAEFVEQPQVLPKPGEQAK